MIKLEPEAILTPATALTVSSSGELKSALLEFKTNRLFRSRYVSVAINEDRVLSRVFRFPKVSREEIRRLIVTEAADLLSLTAGEIEIDYQILYSDQEKVEGAFICASREVVAEYLKVIDGFGLIPLKLMDALLTGIDGFLAQAGDQVEDGCYIDLSQKGTIHFSVIQDRVCRFLRKVKYDSMDEAVEVTIQTLQGMSAQRTVKKIGFIHMIGDMQDKGLFLERIQKAFEAQIKHHYVNPNQSLVSTHTYFELNLFHRYVFSLRERNLLIICTYLVTLLLLLKSIFLAIDIRSKDIVIKYIQASWSSSEYERAVRLKAELMRSPGEK